MTPPDHPEQTFSDTGGAMYIAWEGQQAALVLSGFVYRDYFHGRAFSILGWQTVTMPLAQFRDLFKTRVLT